MTLDLSWADVAIAVVGCVAQVGTFIVYRGMLRGLVKRVDNVDAQLGLVFDVMKVLDELQKSVAQMNGLLTELRPKLDQLIRQ